MVLWATVYVALHHLFFRMIAYLLQAKSNRHHTYNGLPRPYPHPSMPITCDSRWHVYLRMNCRIRGPSDVFWIFQTVHSPMNYHPKWHFHHSRCNCHHQSASDSWSIDSTNLPQDDCVTLNEIFADENAEIDIWPAVSDAIEPFVLVPFGYKISILGSVDIGDVIFDTFSP